MRVELWSSMALFYALWSCAALYCTKEPLGTANQQIEFSECITPAPTIATVHPRCEGTVCKYFDSATWNNGPKGEEMAYFFIWLPSVSDTMLRRVEMQSEAIRSLSGRKIADVSGEIVWPADGGLTKRDSVARIQKGEVYEVADMELCNFAPSF
ncbi:MAG: hypothetical protein RH862_07550 [Leptospiraceae bacterium]